MQHERLRAEEERAQDYDDHDREQKELEEEDEYQHRSVIQHSRAVAFWKYLTENNLTGTMNMVTRAVPRDPYAGLLHVHSRIWTKWKVAIALLKMCLMCLNFVYITISFLDVWTHQVDFIHHGGNSQVVISKEGAVACVHSSNSDKQCLHTNLHRYYQHLIMTALEFAVVLPMTGAFLVFTLLFLCGGSYTQPLPRKHPWFFFFAPSAILSVSTLQFFQLWHPARIASLWCLNERKFWRLLFTYSIVGPEKKAANASPSRQSSIPSSRESSMSSPRSSSMFEDGTIGQGQQQAKNAHDRWKKFYDFVGICFHIFLVVLTFQGALLKLSAIYFAAVINTLDWNLTEWLLVLGFINQVGTAINPNTVELHRLLLFLFGGANGYWTRRECIKVHHFFSLVAHKICYGKIKDECNWCFKCFPMRLAPLATMWSFTSSDLQSLLFSPARERRLEDGTDLRAGILQHMWDPEYCNTFVERLKEAHHDDGPSKNCTQSVLKIEKERLSDIRDSLVRRVPTAGLDGPEEELIRPIPHSVRLLIAAEIQNSIEDLDEIWKPSPPEKVPFIHRLFQC